jgi:ATP-dependent DNA helicase RecQ
VFLNLPTGGGKSLCYQIPAISQHGMSLVISPLLALMQDQFEKMKAVGIPCATLSSMSSEEDQKTILNGTLFCSAITN